MVFGLKHGDDAISAKGMTVGTSEMHGWNPNLLCTSAFSAPVTPTGIMLFAKRYASSRAQVNWFTIDLSLLGNNAKLVWFTVTRCTLISLVNGMKA